MANRVIKTGRGRVGERERERERERKREGEREWEREKERERKREERERKREERGREEVGGNQFDKQSTNLITYTQCKSHDHLTTPTKTGAM